MMQKEREQSSSVSPSHRFGAEIRQRLTQSFLERPALAPQNPESIESLMEISRKTVSERWRQSVADLLPSNLEPKLVIRQFSDLDYLRKDNPEDWYTLVRASMERQKMETDLLYQWVRDMKDIDFDGLGMGRLELLTALEIAVKIGPLINETYMKQMELLDNPETKKSIIFGDGDGSKYLYQLKQSDGAIEKISYMDMFPDTWPQIVAGLRSLSYKTTMMVAHGQLPPSYAALAGLLEKTAAAYGASELDGDFLNNRWQDLLSSTYDFIAAGCPVDFSVQFNSYLQSYDGNVDAEIRVGIETAKTRAMLEELLPYRDIARVFAQQYDEVLDKPTVPVRVRMQNLLYGAGSNLYWRTQGEAADGTIVCYIDSTSDAAVSMQRDIFHKVFAKEIDDFLDLYTKTVVWHELGHTVLSSEDLIIQKRTGSGTGASMIEELKADVMGYTIAAERSKSPEMLQALVIYCLDYIINRDSTDGYGTSMYAGGGAVILSTLLENNILIKNNYGYEIHDVDRGFSILKNLADEICAVYADPLTTPEKIEAWAKELGNARENEKLQELLSIVQK